MGAMRRSSVTCVVAGLVEALAIAGCGGGSATGGGDGGESSSSSGAGGGNTSGNSGSNGSSGTIASSGSSSGNAGSTGSSSGVGDGASGGDDDASGGGASGTGSDAGSGGGGKPGTCGAGDTNLPAEPTIPPACTTLKATQNVPSGGVPNETSLDTSAIQSALSACAAGQAVKLTTGGSNDAFVTGPLTIPTGVTLWVDAGTTLYGTRSKSVYGSAAALISVRGANSGIVGDGTIDGQGGEPILGGSGSFWDQNGSGGSSPALIAVSGATNFTLYRITLHNAPMFHVKMGAMGFVAWGVTIKTPSKATNSAGTALSYSSAHNTDGIDPGEAASNGFIVCSQISDGDDHIAIKGSSPTGVTHLVIAHNHFEAGHGMSIGSEFTGGVSNVNVYDLSIDGTNTGTGGGSSNGIRIKSDSSRGGLVNDVSYSDVCLRDIANPILLTPTYSTATGSSIPQYTNITFKDVHQVSGGSNTPAVTLDGYDASHLNSVTLDNVVIEGIASSHVTAAYTKVTLGPGAVNFTPSGTGVTVTNAVSGSSTPNPCTDKWVTF